MAAEHAPPGKRAFYSGFPQVGPAPGYLLSAGIFLVLYSNLSESQFLAWGWRIPFLLSIVLVAVGFFVRARLSETPVFRRVAEEGSEARVPILDVLRMYPRTVALASLAGMLIFAYFYVVTVFSISYGVEQLGLSQPTMLYCAMIAIAFMGVGILLFATLSDRIGRRNLALFGTAFVGLWSFPMFWLMDTGNPILITLAFSVGMFAWSAVYGPMGAYFSELFGTRVRYSGASLSYALAGVLGAALAPIVSSYLLTVTGAPWPISLYLLLVAMVSCASILLLSETFRTDLFGLRYEERQLLEEPEAETSSP